MSVFRIVCENFRNELTTWSVDNKEERICKNLMQCTAIRVQKNQWT